MLLEEILMDKYMEGIDIKHSQDTLMQQKMIFLSSYQTPKQYLRLLRSRSYMKVAPTD